MGYSSTENGRAGWADVVGAQPARFAPSVGGKVDLAVRTRNQDLLWPRRAAGLPFHRPIHHAPHLTEPPRCAIEPVTRHGNIVILGLDQSEFELCVIHNLPFSFDRSLVGGVGQKRSNAEECFQKLPALGAPWRRAFVPTTRLVSLLQSGNEFPTMSPVNNQRPKP